MPDIQFTLGKEKLALRNWKRSQTVQIMVDRLVNKKLHNSSIKRGQHDSK